MTSNAWRRTEQPTPSQPLWERIDPAPVSRVPAWGTKDEEDIQVLFNEWPDLVPVRDMSLTRLMLVGREVPLESGYVDLLAVTREGRIVIIEFKVKDNYEARRKVIGQLLDYGACLWKTIGSYARFDAFIAQEYFFGDECVDKRLQYKASLEEAFREFYGPANGSSDDFTTFKAAIEQNLKKGDFVYVVVCPTIADSTKFVLEHLQCTKGISIYGVEVRHSQGIAKGTDAFITSKVGRATAPVRSPRKVMPAKVFWSKLMNQNQRYGDIFRQFGRRWKKEHYGSINLFSDGRSVYCQTNDAQRVLFYVYASDPVKVELAQDKDLDAYRDKGELSAAAVEDYRARIKALGWGSLPKRQKQVNDPSELKAFLDAMLAFAHSHLPKGKRGA